MPWYFWLFTHFLAAAGGAGVLALCIAHACEPVLSPDEHDPRYFPEPRR